MPLIYMEQLCSLLSVPPIETFENNFVNLNPSAGQIALRPNITLDDIIRLYSRTDGDSKSILFSPHIYWTSASIGGVYICRAQDDFGSRNTSVNITVKGLYIITWSYCISFHKKISEKKSSCCRDGSMNALAADEVHKQGMPYSDMHSIA